MGVVDGSTNWNGQDNFQDFIQFHADKLCMTREEYMSHYGSANAGLSESKPGPDPYHRGLEDGEVEDKEDQIKKQADMDDDDPDAYEEMPGDEEAREKGEVKTSDATKAYNKLYKEHKYVKSMSDFNESSVTEAKAYKLKASEFGANTHSAAYNVKGEPTWRVHSTYAIDQVSGDNNPEERDVVFFEAMPINKDIYIKIGGINNLKRSNGSTYGNNFSTTIEEWKNDPKGIAKEASEFLTDATHLKWLNKKARSEGQVIKWALKDDYSSVIEDLVNKSLGLTESIVTEADDKEQKSTDRGPLSDDAIETGLKKKAKESGVPIGIIRAVMRRGLAAWKSGHRPGANQQQWGYARVNAFLTKGEGTWGNADKDLAKEVRDGGHDKKLKKA